MNEMRIDLKEDALAGLRVDGERLWAALMELAQIGATAKGGVKRLALTDLDRQGRDLVVKWGVDAGMAITVDQIGNVFMRREGRNPALPPVMTGSHIDTQPTGGKFDGNYGVLAGLEVVRTLNDAGIETEAPIEVAFWTNEEGSRFVPVMMGSGVSWYDCVVTGMEAHAGPTPMGLRRDALQVATVIMQEVVAIANRYPPYGRGTVGMVQVFPNSRNVIPGEVKFSIDLRNVNDALLNTMHEEMLAFVDKVRADSGLGISVERVSYYPPCPFHPDCVGAVRKATAALGYSTMDVVSGAGHDAIYAARLAPAGMIFVPCKDGISHNEIEDAKSEHLEAGCNVLLHAMLERAVAVAV